MSFRKAIASRVELNQDRVIAAAITLALTLALIYGINWNFILALDFFIVQKYFNPLLNGLLVTLGITLTSLFLGSISGVLLAVAYRLGNKPIQWLITAHIEIWRNTPLLIQVFWIHFALPTVTGISTSILVSGTLALTLQASAYLAEIIKAGIASVPRGQWDGARSLGLHAYVTWRKIILPQAIRTMLPPLVNTAFSFFKGSTILSILGVRELMRMGNIISIHSYKPIEIMTTVGVIYLFIGLIFTLISRFVEKKLG